MNGLTPAFQGELMLANWKESHALGASVTFLLADAADLDIFRSMTVRKANMAGQRFMAVLVEIGDDEKPVTLKLSQQSALLCKSLGFQQFVASRQGCSFDDKDRREKQAADFVRTFCQIESRSMLDSNGTAGMRYQQMLANYRNHVCPNL